MRGSLGYVFGGGGFGAGRVFEDVVNVKMRVCFPPNYQACVARCFVNPSIVNSLPPLPSPFHPPTHPPYAQEEDE